LERFFEIKNDKFFAKFFSVKNSLKFKKKISPKKKYFLNISQTTATINSTTISNHQTFFFDANLLGVIFLIAKSLIFMLPFLHQNPY